jgi:hypothetical protein
MSGCEALEPGTRDRHGGNRLRVGPDACLSDNADRFEEAFELGAFFGAGLWGDGSASDGAVEEVVEPILAHR